MNLKVIIIGILISCVLLDMLVYPLGHMILGLLGKIDFTPPVIFYIVWSHSSIFISGIYIGLSKARNKLLIGVIVGLLYLPMRDLLAVILIKSRQFDFNLIQYAYGLSKYGLVCTIGSWLSSKGILLIRRWKDSRNLGA